MKLTTEQIKNVLALPGPKRYEHFIKVIVDWEQVWGLYKDGWALAATANAVSVFPLWPAKEYAELCATRLWDGYQPRSFDLDDFLNYLLPKMRRDNVLPGIFYTPNDKGVTPSVEQVIRDIRAEMIKYE